MVKFNHDAHTIQEAFNLNELDYVMHKDFLARMNEKHTTVTKTIARVWVDERMSDNLKCYLLFTLGRCYEHL